jgi:hypothetical protein
MMPVVELVEANLAAERVPVDPEQTRGARLVAARPVQHAFDELLLEFVDGLVELDPALHHLPDQGLQLIFHSRTLRMKIFRGRKFRPDLFEFVAC